MPVYYIKCSMGVVFLEVLNLKETASLGDKLTEKGKFAVDSKDSVLTHVVSMFTDITICMSFIS